MQRLAGKPLDNRSSRGYCGRASSCRSRPLSLPGPRGERQPEPAAYCRLGIRCHGANPAHGARLAEPARDRRIGSRSGCNPDHDAIDNPMPAPAVAVGPVEGCSAGKLPMEVTAADRWGFARRRCGTDCAGAEPANPPFGPLAEGAWPLLTPREIEVLAALRDGLSNKAAARRLGSRHIRSNFISNRCSESSARPRVLKPSRRG